MVTHSSNLPGKSCEQRSLVGYNPRGCKRIRHKLATKQQQSQPIRRQAPLKREILLTVLKKGRKAMPPGEASRVHQEAEKRGNVDKNF